MGLRQGVRKLARAMMDWVSSIGDVLRLVGLGGMVSFMVLWCYCVTVLCGYSE